MFPSAELVRSFTLTGPDCDLIAVRRRPANRLGIAMQLCALRYLTTLTNAYEDLLKNVNEMINVSNAVVRDMNELFR